MRAVASIVAACAAVLAAVAPSAAEPEPAAPATAFSAVVRYSGGSELVAWTSPERFAVRLVAGRPLLGGTVQRGAPSSTATPPGAPPRS